MTRRRYKRSFRRYWSSSRGAVQNHSAIALSRRPLKFSRGRLLACLRQLLIEFAVADRSIKVSMTNQFVERWHCDCGFALPP